MVWFDSELIKWLTPSLERHGEREKNTTQGVNQASITRWVHYKFNCITVNYDRTQHRIYIII